MVCKLGKVLFCVFLFAILGVDYAQNLAKHKRWLRVLIQLTTEADKGQSQNICEIRKKCF